VLKIEIKKIDIEELKELRNKDYEYLIFQGCGGDLDEWITGATEMFKDNGIVKGYFDFKEVYQFEKDDITNLAFDLSSNKIDMSKLALFRLKIRNEFGAVWLSDYIDNYLAEDIVI